MAPFVPISEPTPTRREAFASLKAGLNNSTIAAPRASLEDGILSGVAALDRLVGGGFPRGALVTFEGDAGRWSIAVRLIAQVTRRAMAAIVDDGCLYPPSLVRAGVKLERLLVVPAQTPMGVARAVDILVRSKGHIKSLMW